MPTQQGLTKVQQHSLEMLCGAIRIIDDLVPLEFQRFSRQRKRKLESAHVTLRHHAETFAITFPMLSMLYNAEEYLLHAHLVADRLATRLAPPWRSCEKTTPTRTRQLTPADYAQRHGIIETREGPAPFAPGDYLAIDALGEYPIRYDTIACWYTQENELDANGWAFYLSHEPREAIQVFRAFPTDRGVNGQAGDYKLRGQNKRMWPCAKTKFEQEYRLVQEGVA